MRYHTISPDFSQSRALYTPWRVMVGIAEGVRQRGVRLLRAGSVVDYGHATVDVFNGRVAESADDPNVIFEPPTMVCLEITRANHIFLHGFGIGTNRPRPSFC